MLRIDWYTRVVDVLDYVEQSEEFGDCVRLISVL
jgi:hypothetical protein